MDTAPAVAEKGPALVGAVVDAEQARAAPWDPVGAGMDDVGGVELCGRGWAYLG